MKPVDAWTLEPIATVQSPYQEKFGIPRQSGLTDLPMKLHLHPERVQPSALQGIEQGSHLWLLFGFHGIAAVPQASTVRPPRLGGNTRIGVYATRSPFRPNRLGLSLVRLLGVAELSLEISGADLLDQTPVFDIKPYVAYADTPPGQSEHWAQQAPTPVAVQASQELQTQLERQPKLHALWSQVQDYLRWDPRPSYRKIPDPHQYRQRFCNHEIQFRRQDHCIVVERIEPKTTPQGIA